MSAPDEHISSQWDEVHKLDKQLSSMRRWGVLESDPGYQALWRARGAALAKVGTRVPRLTTPVWGVLALSPGQIQLFADAEVGWLVEARDRPGAPPVYKYVSDEVAEKLVTGQLTKELELELMSPDTYIGE